jgi:hypothetical protein
MKQNKKARRAADAHFIDWADDAAINKERDSDALHPLQILLPPSGISSARGSDKMVEHLNA